MRRLFCLLGCLLTHNAIAADHVLDARLMLASNSAALHTQPALQGVVQQFASQGVRSAVVLDHAHGVERANLAAYDRKVDVHIATLSANRARVVVDVQTESRTKKIALEIPKNRDVLIGIGRTADGLIVASVHVKAHLDAR